MNVSSYIFLSCSEWDTFLDFPNTSKLLSLAPGSYIIIILVAEPRSFTSMSGR